MNGVGPDDIVVTSTGLISREVFTVKDRELNFYMQGSMGCALAIGMGIALHVKNKVIVIQGDGAALMGLGSFATMNALGLKNLVHIIIDNGCHESTGFQPTTSDTIAFSAISDSPMHVFVPDSFDCPVPPRITLSPAQITARFKNALFHQQKKQTVI